MSQTLSTLAAALPLAAGWSVHSLRLRRRIEAAGRDPLTSLMRREAFEARAGRELRKGLTAVVVIDLDGFKALNDTHGHAAGDVGLVVVAARLNDWAIRMGGCAARLGGDEFAAVATAAHQVDLLSALEDLHETLREPFTFDGEPVELGASIGAIRHDDELAGTLPALMRRADEAMYVAKESGGGWYVAEGLAPVRDTVNGRRAGRPGTGREVA
ncbi:GGDEF domain-containing protein [Streptomyces sp. NRRL S-118]|uniref:GGDEF domain-containing protein n=1 Tax=Streptomyces sp. NRRL S-118 TaxID=1463881 RepID=UPI0004CC3E27|nr:GGDEF domain-containing protein [Streptomyces sp. NRRL S-118]